MKLYFLFHLNFCTLFLNSFLFFLFNKYVQRFSKLLNFQYLFAPFTFHYKQYILLLLILSTRSKYSPSNKAVILLKCFFFVWTSFIPFCRTSIWLFTFSASFCFCTNSKLAWYFDRELFCPESNYLKRQWYVVLAHLQLDGFWLFSEILLIC